MSWEAMLVLRLAARMLWIRAWGHAILPGGGTETLIV
jgi:hypothetical protein